MKFLGIDYGTKRIGLAVSDDGGTLAFPKEIIPSGAYAIDKIGAILKKENISAVVIGESLDFSGIPNPIAEKAELFACLIEKEFGVKVHRQKEFLTSVEARRAGKTKESFQNSQAHSKIKKERDDRADASAAALILQRFLDRRSRLKEG